MINFFTILKALKSPWPYILIIVVGAIFLWPRVDTSKTETEIASLTHVANDLIVQHNDSEDRIAAYGVAVEEAEARYAALKEKTYVIPASPNQASYDLCYLRGFCVRPLYCERDCPCERGVSSIP